jgi:hypothetical protein
MSDNQPVVEELTEAEMNSLDGVTPVFKFSPEPDTIISVWYVGADTFIEVNMPFGGNGYSKVVDVHLNETQVREGYFADTE